MTELNAEYVRECLHYDPDTGEFTWKRRPVEHFVDGEFWTADQKCANWNRRNAGTPAGALSTHGYIKISINGREHFAHRLAWLVVTGVCPDGQIDHINGIRADNKFANLREATNAENNQNTKAPATNTSGAKGVHLFKRTGRWQANIQINGKKRHLGYFKTIEAAIAARIAAEAELHPFSSRPEVISYRLASFSEGVGT